MLGMLLVKHGANARNRNKFRRFLVSSSFRVPQVVLSACTFQIDLMPSLRSAFLFSKTYVSTDDLNLNLSQGLQPEQTINPALYTRD